MSFMGLSFGRRSRWEDLSEEAKRGIAVATSVQMALLAGAVADLIRRPAEEIRGGRKWPWFPVLLVNFVGPITYLLFGRRNGETAGEREETANGRKGKKKNRRDREIPW